MQEIELLNGIYRKKSFIANKNCYSKSLGRAKVKHLFSILATSKEDIEDILSLAKKIEEKPDEYSKSAENKILATLFFEPSTRTRLSFESAMLRLGGKILGFSSAKTTSAAKGESVSDTIRMINGYADIAVIRHFLEGIEQVAEKFATIPFISGGTGTQEHPTQALLDLYTIKKELGTIDNITVGLMGDLQYGRTIPSLLYGLAKYDNVKIKLIAPDALKLRKGVLYRLKEMSVKFSQHTSIRDVIDELDVLYVTRIQKERFPDPTDYEKVKGSYRITTELLKDVKENFILLHPLPRVTEIDYEVDTLPCAKYFSQAKNGVWVRMAIILKLLEEFKK